MFALFGNPRVCSNSVYSHLIARATCVGICVACSNASRGVFEFTMNPPPDLHVMKLPTSFPPANTLIQDVDSSDHAKSHVM